MAVPALLKRSRRSQETLRIAALNRRLHVSTCEPSGCLGHGRRTQVSEVLPGQAGAPRRCRLRQRWRGAGAAAPWPAPPGGGGGRQPTPAGVELVSGGSSA